MKKEEGFKKGGRPVGTAIKKKVIYQREYDLFLKKLAEDKIITEHRKIYTKKAVCLLFNGGFRVNEITTLTCDDICDAVFNRQIHLANDTKTKTGRNVFFSVGAVDRMKDIFAYEIEHCGDKLVFNGRGGSYSRVNVSSFSSELNKLLKKYLGRGYSSHSFRHGYVTDLVKSGGVKLAKEAVGHKSVSTTLLYTEVTEDDIKEGIDKVR